MRRCGLAAAVCSALVAACAVAVPLPRVVDVEMPLFVAAGAAPTRCGADNITLEHWGASPALDRYNFTMGSDNVTFYFGMSPCERFQFADSDGFLCDRENAVNIQSFDRSPATCGAGYITASSPVPTYDPAGKVLRLFFVEFNATHPQHLDLVVMCDRAAAKPVAVQGRLREGYGTVLTFRSAAACPELPTTTAAPVPTGPPGPSGEPGTTAPPTPAPTPAPPVGPTPPPQDHSTREPTSTSVIIGGCILGAAFIAVVCVLRRWAVQSREEAQGEYIGVAESTTAA